jgi:hypothetical protein
VSKQKERHELTLTTLSLAATARMSAQETTPGQVFSTYGGLDGVDDLEASN